MKRVGSNQKSWCAFMYRRLCMCMGNEPICKNLREEDRGCAPEIAVLITYMSAALPEP